MLSILVFVVLAAGVRSAEVCCPDIGCFTDDPPFDGIEVPMCPSEMDLHYLMYTQSSPSVGQEFDHLSTPGNFDRTKRIIFVTHGWNSDGTSTWLHTMKDALLAAEDANVVIVDWGGGAQLANYFQAASNTRSVGAYTALVVDNLIANGGLASNVWLMGHSLGGHHVGHAGMRSVNNLRRVTGLDPAGPWFEGNVDRTVGINPTSGQYVDIIHTDNELGTTRDVGHADYYPAGGAVDQPGCRRVEVAEGEMPDPRNVCSHSRAYEFMEASISTDCFYAWSRCSDWSNLPGSCSSCTCGSNPCAKMGYSAMSSCQTNGWFYLDVGPTPPYCLG